VGNLAPVRVRARSTAVMNQRAFVIRHTPFVCSVWLAFLLAIGKTLR
jgi:hypothetical protein